MVTPAMRTTAVLLGFLNLTKYAMFSFAMTSGLASDSDKFKINITLRRALKFRDTEDASFVSGVVVCCRCHWESRPQEGGGIAQAWATWPEGASAPNGTMMCRGHGVPEMVTPAMRTTAVLLGFLNLTKYAMFSFAMTSGLANDSDKFKINITLRRALKFRDTEDASFVSGVVVCCRCLWESRPQEGGGIAQAWATWPEGASAPNGTMMCRGHGVPEMVTPAMRTTAVLLGFLNLTKYAMFSFTMTSGLASDSDKLKN